MPTKVRAPTLPVYTGFYIVYYKDIGGFQILFSIYVGNIGAYPWHTSIIVLW
jgi:hypothetical protein